MANIEQQMEDTLVAWAQQDMETGAELERERILSILEKLDRHGTTHSEFCAARHAYAAKAIALIKGEQE